VTRNIAKSAEKLQHFAEVSVISFIMSQKLAFGPAK
jgi:hypothetical protein